MSEFWLIVIATLGVALQFVLLWFSRVVITGYSLCRHPVSTIMSIPQNWVRAAFSTDSCHSPEPIPGCELLGGDYRAEAIRLSRHARTFRYYVESSRWPAKVAWALFILMPAIIGFLPPLLYRLAVKSSALVYAPLVWVLGPAVPTDRPIAERLEEVLNAPYERLRGSIPLSFGLLGLFSSL